jgi:hypothetical protein
MHFTIAACLARVFLMALATVFAVAIGICVGAQSVSARQALPNRQALKQACMNDYQSLCAGTFPGGGRIKACLIQNMAKLSPDCRNALQKANASQ